MSEGHLCHCYLVISTMSSSRNSSTGKVEPGMWIIGQLPVRMFGRREIIEEPKPLQHRCWTKLERHTGCSPKYSENFTALRVALIRTTLRSSLCFRRSFTMMSNTSDWRFLSWISSRTRWLTLDNRLTPEEPEKETVTRTKPKCPQRDKHESTHTHTHTGVCFCVCLWY